jgi:hypothetical protein
MKIDILHVVVLCMLMQIQIYIKEGFTIMIAITYSTEKIYDRIKNL